MIFFKTFLEQDQDKDLKAQDQDQDLKIRSRDCQPFALYSTVVETEAELAQFLHEMLSPHLSRDVTSLDPAQP